MVDFVEVEDEIELANATEILVQHLHKQVDELKHGQLVIFSIDTEREEEPCVPPIHYLVISILRSSPHANTSREGPSESNSEKPKRRSETYLEETSVLVVSRHYEPVCFSLNLLPLVIIVRDVPST